MTTSKRLVCDYLMDRATVTRDLDFCSVAPQDKEKIILSIDGILNDREFLERLEKISTALLGSDEEWNVAPWKGLPYEDDGGAASVPDYYRYALVFPLLNNLDATMEGYRERGIPLCVLKSAMEDLPRWIETFNERMGGKDHGFKEINWLRETMLLRLFQVGRLQFQIGSIEKSMVCLRERGTGKVRFLRKEEAESLNGDDWENVACGGDPAINIHIPSGTKLSPALCRQAIDLAPNFFKRYFPNDPIASANVFQCASWLLYDDFKEILPSTSNIVSFINLFDDVMAIESAEGDHDFYQRVFLTRSVVKSKLKTSLQRALFDHIKAGKKLFPGHGIITVKPQRKLRLGVLGSGSGSNMQSISDAINAGTLNAEIVVVLSDHEDAGILERGKRCGIPSRYVDHAPFKTKLEGKAEDDVIKILRDAEVDLVVLAGYMRVVKAKLLEAFPNRVINIHPALLPSFPGIAGWKQALDYGAKVAGPTVHFVNLGIDSGPIIVQRVVPVLDDDTPASLHARIQVEEHIAYPDAIRRLSENRLLIAGRTVITL